MNKVILIGRLGNDPETKYTPAGVAITRCSIATSQKWKDKNTGEVKEQTEWHRVTFFGKKAEVAGEYLKKGHRACVEGRIHYGEYTDRDGIKRYTTEIHADQLEFVQDKPPGETSYPHSTKGAPAPANSATAGPPPNFDEEEIPF